MSWHRHAKLTHFVHGRRASGFAHSRRSDLVGSEVRLSTRLRCQRVERCLGSRDLRPFATDDSTWQMTSQFFSAVSRIAPIYHAAGPHRRRLTRHRPPMNTHATSSTTAGELLRRGGAPKTLCDRPIYGPKFFSLNTQRDPGGSSGAMWQAAPGTTTPLNILEQKKRKRNFMGRQSGIRKPSRATATVTATARLRRSRAEALGKRLIVS